MAEAHGLRVVAVHVDGIRAAQRVPAPVVGLEHVRRHAAEVAAHLLEHPSPRLEHVVRVVGGGAHRKFVILEGEAESLRAVPQVHRDRFIRRDGDEEEGAVATDIDGGEPLLHVRDGRCVHQVEDEPSTAGVAAGHDRAIGRVVVQQAQREAILIDGDPRAARIRVGRRKVANAARGLGKRRMRLKPGLALVPVEEDVIPVRRAEPRYRAHATWLCM